MVPRTLTSRLRAAAEQYPVVTLTGPRQSGKTTLVRATFPGHGYVSLEDPELRTLALEDPKGLLGRFRGRVILDEVQRVPDLFSYIQMAVDEQNVPGQFILTGSQNFLPMQTVSQTLAGRCAVLHLLPFALHELGGRPPVVLAELGREVPQPPHSQQPADLFELLVRGFYPRVHDRDLLAREWLGYYYRTYVERDVRTVTNVGDLETFGRFVRLCAGRCGQLLNLSSLAVDAGVTHTTARRWLSILEASFIVYLLRPHHRNFSKRLIRSPKLYLLDTGLLCYLLRIASADDLRLSPYRGAVFECFAVSELVKNFLHRGAEAPLFFWRDSAGHEVDVIIDFGRLQLPVEVKSAETVRPELLAGIDYWRKLAGSADHPAALVYAGTGSYRHRQVTVCSWEAL
jgi:uncharacterized protein